MNRFISIFMMMAIGLSPTSVLAETETKTIIRDLQLLENGNPYTGEEFQAQISYLECQRGTPPCLRLIVNIRNISDKDLKVTNFLDMMTMYGYYLNGEPGWSFLPNLRQVSNISAYAPKPDRPFELEGVTLRTDAEEISQALEAWEAEPYWFLPAHSEWEIDFVVTKLRRKNDPEKYQLRFGPYTIQIRIPLDFNGITVQLKSERFKINLEP